MSISPQSLARTRDKRSLRIPRKFEDFSLVTSGDAPTEVSHSTYRNFAEALKMKGKPTKRDSGAMETQSSSKKLPANHNAETTSTSSTIPHDSLPNPAQHNQGISSSSTSHPKGPSSSSSSSSSTTTTAAAATASTSKSPLPPATKTVSPDSAPTPKRPPPKQRNIPAQVSSENVEQLNTPNSSNGPPQSPPSNRNDIDLECKEAITGPDHVMFRPPFPMEIDDIDRLIEDKGGNSVENLDKHLPPTKAPATKVTATKVTATNQTIKKIDDNVIKKSPFHPSITISNGIRISGPVTKPVVKRRPRDPMRLMPWPLEDEDQRPPRPVVKKKPRERQVMTMPLLCDDDELPPPPIVRQTSPKPVSRKKAQGFSLMLKVPNNNGVIFQGNNNNSIGPNDGTNNVPINACVANNNGRPFVPNQQQQQQQQQQQIHLQQLQQQTKYYNNLSQNMQYGARLMINEPIYLPRTVASIAPITTTLQQIANQARRPPFLSKKAEACMAFQDGRKFDLITSNFTALQKITKHLEVRDLLNLRLVNKTWKSIIDSDACWKKVKVKESKINSWNSFASRMQKYGTTDLILDEFTPKTSYSELILDRISTLVKHNMRRIWIRTVNEIQNKFAIELACKLNSIPELNHDLALRWRVKVIVDEYGIALIPTRGNEFNWANHTKSPDSIYRYSKLHGKPKETVLVELSDLEDLFNGGKNDIGAELHKASGCKVRIDIKPI